MSAQSVAARLLSRDRHGDEDSNKAKDKRKAADLRAVPVRRRIGVLTTLGLTFLVLLLLGMVAFQAFIVRNQSALDELDSQVAEARKTNELLRFQVSELESPDRIRGEAIDRLGMIQPEEVIYLPPISEAELVPDRPQPVDETDETADAANDEGDTGAGDPPSDPVDEGER